MCIAFILPEVTRDCCPECGEHFDASVGVSP